MNKINENIKRNEKTFTYLYIPDLDTLEHHNSPYNEIVYQEVKKIEESFKKILDCKDTVFIITADHGQLPIKDVVYMDLNIYDKYFYAYPGMDMGTACFYVKKGMEKEFENKFVKDFHNKMSLFKMDEFINKKIFGGKLTKYAQSSLGEYIGICHRNYAFYSEYGEVDRGDYPKGNHSGLSKEEFITPLIVINKEEL
jgi:hypothetical protein